MADPNTTTNRPLPRRPERPGPQGRWRPGDGDHNIPGAGHFTGRCMKCGSSNLWQDNLAYGCNACGAFWCGAYVPRHEQPRASHDCKPPSALRGTARSPTVRNCESKAMNETTTYLKIGPSERPWINLTGWAATATLCAIILAPAGIIALVIEATR